MMKNIDKVKMQAILLFIAVDEAVELTNETKLVNCKNQNEVDEFTEIWELVKK
jgi:hypothetical protein